MTDEPQAQIRPRVSDEHRGRIETRAHRHFSEYPRVASTNSHLYVDSEVLALCLDLRDCRAERDALAAALDEGQRRDLEEYRRVLAMVGALREALDSIANHPTGWPPPEEENSSMRGIANAALNSTAEVARQYEDRIRREERERCARLVEFLDHFAQWTGEYARAIADKDLRAGFLDHITHIGMAREELRQPDNPRDGTR